jgi:hypothetical protein
VSNVLQSVSQEAAEKGKEDFQRDICAKRYAAVCAVWARSSRSLARQEYERRNLILRCLHACSSSAPSVSLLAARTNMSEGDVSAVVDGLWADGYVVRTGSGGVKLRSVPLVKPGTPSSERNIKKLKTTTVSPTPTAFTASAGAGWRVPLFTGGTLKTSKPWKQMVTGVLTTDWSAQYEVTKGVKDVSGAEAKIVITAEHINNNKNNLNNSKNASAADGMHLHRKSTAPAHCAQSVLCKEEEEEMEVSTSAVQPAPAAQAVPSHSGSR